MYVVNLKGEKEPFSLQKVFRSAKRAGASPLLAKQIAKKIEKLVYPGITTSEIYKRVKQFLKKENKGAGLRFSLKEAMRKLGPSGFPFEKYVGEIFSVHGFEVKLNQIVKGKYATHEIDFVAKKDKLLYIAECKFRHHRGERIDLPITLAFWAKFQDLLEGKYLNRFTNCKIKPILITNAKFTRQAKRYAQGVGIELLGWNFPKNKGLENMIEKELLYPITILPSFKGFLVDVFSSKFLMLAKDILELDIKKFVQKEKLDIKKLEKLKQEAKILFDDSIVRK